MVALVPAEFWAQTATPADNVWVKVLSWAAEVLFSKRFMSLQLINTKYKNDKVPLRFDPICCKTAAVIEGLVISLCPLRNHN